MYSRNEILHAGAKAMWEQGFDDLPEQTRAELMLAVGAGFDAMWPMLRENIQERFDNEWELSLRSVLDGP